MKLTNENQMKIKQNKKVTNARQNDITCIVE